MGAPSHATPLVVLPCYIDGKLLYLPQVRDEGGLNLIAEITRNTPEIIKKASV